MTDHIRVLIVDDQPRARQGLRALLSTCAQIGGLLEAANGQEAVRLVGQAQPDVVLMDARMPEMDGVEATRTIKAAWPRVKVIVLSIYGQYDEPAHTAGADAFMHKGEASGRLLDTLLAVVAR